MRNINYLRMIRKGSRINYIYRVKGKEYIMQRYMEGQLLNHALIAFD